MSIVFDQKSSTLSLHTRNSSYQMQIGPLGYLLHTYYGRRCEDFFDYLHLPRDCGFSPNPYTLREGRGFSLDTLPQEYSGSNGADFRLSSLELRTDSGVVGADLHYVSHRILQGKYRLSGLPSSFGDMAETLSVTLADAASGLEVELLYGVFEERDIITRAVRLHNCGTQTVCLEKVASVCLDLPFGPWDRIHFHGRHTMERQPERVPVANGIQTVSSARGASSHQHNPFVILCEPDATEDHGECCGVMLCYSGDHQTDVELDQTGSVRLTAGIGERHFSWRLNPGESFDTPEAFLCFSSEGLTVLSQRYHRFILQNLCRSEWIAWPRPVLLNSWEANYFSFDEDALLRLAREAKDLGVEFFVLDDGWFGHRDDDLSSLGDWYVNPGKLPHGLSALIDRVNDLGLKFGLWVEPEMISEDSDLYRAHPDWALSVPGRQPAISRDQLVLDLSRPEVADWVYETLSTLLRENNIEYIKWDMNRSLSDLYSSSLPPDRQGEVAHRYVLGLYSVLDRITAAYPDVLFEGCAGGGGRFDAGMLAYCPQIWCSDNTDPIARLQIHQGSSYGYPPCTMGAHVSASPNHQTGRSTPFGTRAVVAMAGTFGYELDPAALSPEERAEIRKQIALFHSCSDLLLTGDYYRLTKEGAPYTAWQTVSQDRRRTLVSLVLKTTEGNPKPLHLRFKGLIAEGRYRLAWQRNYGFAGLPGTAESSESTAHEFSGAALMYGGYTFPRIHGDYPSVQLCFELLQDSSADS
ncbi:MAG: alpha-galactosidase [Oscillospiraceae bacterium]|nr:alpha-galactosidase [Oscillospiraceae bacterium]